MSATILIVDDNEVSLRYLVYSLKAEDVIIFTANNGQQAVDFCKNSDKTIDVVLMDIQMPIMDGYEASKLIREILPEVPIIAQTGYAMISDMENIKASFNDYVSKPIEIDLLNQKLYFYLNK